MHLLFDIYEHYLQGRTFIVDQYIALALKQKHSWLDTSELRVLSKYFYQILHSRKRRGKEQSVKKMGVY